MTTMANFKTGDRVRVLAEYRDSASEADGYTGTLLRVDRDDRMYPYLVDRDEGSSVWVHSVEVIDATPAQEREALVSRAKELLTGTEHTGADVIRMAEFLAGGE